MQGLTVMQKFKLRVLQLKARGQTTEAAVAAAEDVAAEHFSVALASSEDATHKLNRYIDISGNDPGLRSALRSILKDVWLMRQEIMRGVDAAGLVEKVVVLEQSRKSDDQSAHGYTGQLDGRPMA